MSPPASPPAADVVLAMVSDTWPDAVRRGFYSTADQLVLSLLDDERVGRLLVADHPRGVAAQLLRRARGEGPAPTTPLLAGTRPSCLRTPTPHDPAALDRRYRSYDTQVRVRARLRRMHRPALVTFNLAHAATGPRSGWGPVAFYAQDDETQIPGPAADQERARAAYARVAASGVRVWAVSEVLLDRIAPRGPGGVVPNGVDAELWRDLPAPAPRPEHDGRPVVAYAGTVDDRLDVAALRAVAADGARLVVAGPVADPAVGAALAAVPGVELPGPLPRTEVVSLLRSADVCLLAHRSTPLTEAMSPLKYVEYVCSGRPVVATRLGGLQEVGTSTTTVAPGGDYVGAVREALGRGGLAEADRRVLVEQLSWRARQRPVVDHLVAAAGA